MPRQKTRKPVWVKHVKGEYPVMENREDSLLTGTYNGFAEKEAIILRRHVGRSREVLAVIGTSGIII